MNVIRLAILLLAVSTAAQETHKVQVYAQTTNGEPIEGLKLCPKNQGACSSETDATGRAEIVLPADVKPGDPLDLTPFLPPGFAVAHKDRLIPNFNSTQSAIRVECFRIKPTKRMLPGARVPVGERIRELTTKNILLGQDPEKAKQSAENSLGDEYGIDPSIIDKTLRKGFADPQDLIGGAELAYYRDDYQTAETLFEAALNKGHWNSSEEAHALSLLGLVKLSLGKIPGSLDVMKRAYRLDQENDEIRMGYAATLIANGNFVEARHILEAALQRGSSINVEDQFLFAVFLSQITLVSSGSGDAIKFGQMAIDLSSQLDVDDQSYALCSLANIHITLNQLSAARTVLDKYAGLESTTKGITPFARSFCLKAEATYSAMTGDSKSADDKLRLAKTIGISTPSLLPDFSSGDLKEAEGQFIDAENEYRQVYQHVKKSLTGKGLVIATAEVKLALMVLWNGKPAEAVALINQAVDDAGEFEGRPFFICKMEFYKARALAEIGDKSATSVFHNGELQFQSSFPDDRTSILTEIFLEKPQKEMGPLLFDRAIASYQHSLEIERRLLDSNDPFIFSTESDLGRALYVTNHEKEALQYLGDAERFQRRFLKITDSDRLYTHLNLGWVLLEMGEYERAESVAAEAYNVLKEMNDSAFRTANIFAVTDLFLRTETNLHKFTRARELQIEALAKATDPDDIVTQTAVWNSSALLLLQLKDYKGASTWAEKVRDKCRPIPTIIGYRCQLALAIEGYIAVSSRQWLRAEMLLRQAISLFKERNTPIAPDLANVYLALADVFHHNKKRQDEEAALNKALRIRESALGSDNILTKEAAARLARLND